MSDYVLIYEGGSMPETPEAQKRSMDEWAAWFTTLGSAVKDQGNPFGEAAKTVASDGSVSDDRSAATGYSILTADSVDEAATLAKGCPVLQGKASIRIHEVFEVM